MKINKIILSLAASLALAATIHAKPQEFDFKDPKGVNNVSFTLDAPLEQIAGTAAGVTGTVTFDPKKPESISGTITVATESLQVPNNSMQEHMLGSGWLDAESHPEITFKVKSASHIKETKRGVKAKLTGDFTLKGVTKEITVGAVFSYLPDMVAARTNGRAEGDLLVIRSEFTINRSDYGIKPGENQDKVAEEIVLKMAIAGAAYRQASSEGL